MIADDLPMSSVYPSEINLSTVTVEISGVVTANMSVFLQNLTTFATIVNMSVISGGKRSGIRRLSRGGNYGTAIFPYLICAAQAA